MRLLVTGSAGLVGRGLLETLAAHGIATRGFDLLDGDDVCDRERLALATRDCDGVVHLAAVSRPLWAQRDPDACWATNVGGTENVVDVARSQRHRPFVLFASSREVYGEPRHLPVDEDAPAMPVNVYGRSKVVGEQRVATLGPRGAVVRLSNVYGDPDDHADRVVPAFLRAAIAGDELRVEGPERCFDFTHLRDVARGLLCAVHKLAGEATLPTLHLVSGQSTTLGSLASLAIAIAGRGRPVEHEGRSWDVARFRGDPRRAARVLGWHATVPLDDGLRELARALMSR